MNKFINILFSGLLLLSINAVIAADNTAPAKSDTKAKEYDFENYSYNVSDEQLQKDTEEEVFKEERHASFWSRIINSSHFSSNTATRTYVPLKKAE